MKPITLKIQARLQIGELTKVELADTLGISRVTLDTRLQKGNWKKSELALLKTIV